MKFQSTKSFFNYPCSHRRWRHDGHCAHVHGYSRSFHFTFECLERTENGFVMDFGKLSQVKTYLEDTFDHTLLLDADDPLLSKFRELEELGACRLVTFEDVGMEGTAHHVFKTVSSMIEKSTNGRVWITKLEVKENNKNSAIVHKVS